MVYVHILLNVLVDDNYTVSIIPDRYRSVPIYISDRPSVSIGTDFFRHDFHKGEGLERSDSESDKRHMG